MGLPSDEPEQDVVDLMKDLEIFAATDGIKILLASPQNERADKFYQRLEYLEAPDTDPPTRFKLLA